MIERLGFDNEKYLEMQSEHIRSRIDQFGGKLYLEFGGKLFDDNHASRVLPGFHPDSKIRMLMQLKDQVEIVVAVSAMDLEKSKVRGDLGITYGTDTLRLIDAFRGFGFPVGSVVLTRFSGQPAAEIFQSQLEALGLKANDFVALSAGKREAALKTAGVLVKTLGAAVPGHMDKEQYAFCWIVDFPMYEIGEESGELEFCHNPFSMPSGGLEVLLKAERGEIDPLSITADQYDLVCNGVELSSGAVRNHDPEIMIKAFEMVRLGEEDVKAKFPAMYNAFTYGAPPHAGIAPGVDRMVMLLAGEDSIREIIPFPMNKNAQDVMMSAPSEVTQKQLDELHIAIVKPQD